MLVEAAVAGLGLLHTTDWRVGPLLCNGRLLEGMTNWPVADRGCIHVLTSAAASLPRKTRSLSD